MSDKELLIELYRSTKGKFWLRKDNWISAEPCRRWFGLTINSSGHVTVINLRRNHLQESLNNVLSWRMLSNIHTICLSENSLTGRIPPQLGDMKSLEELDLSWNEFNGKLQLYLCHVVLIDEIFCVGHLPDELFTLTNLRVLKLEHNRLEGEISEHLSRFTKLRFLDISMNQFSGRAMVTLMQRRSFIHIVITFAGKVPKVGHLLPDLKIFNFSRNNFTGTSVDVSKRICSYFMMFNVNIRHRSISREGVCRV